MNAAAAAPSRRERLLRVGIEAVEQGTFDGLSAQDIAARAGVAHGLLFHYFGAMRGFYIEVLRRIIADLELEHAALTVDSPARWLRQDLDVLLRNVATHPHVMEAIRGGRAAEVGVYDMTEGFQDRTVQRILAAMGVEAPGPLLVLALRGWTAYALEVGQSWRRAGGRVARERVRALLIDALSASLQSVAAFTPKPGFDPNVFRG